MAFSKPSFVIKETGLKALIPVVRLGGADGHVSVRWSTKDITALEGKDYQGKEGLLEFDNQETTKNIIIPLFESNVRISIRLPNFFSFLFLNSKINFSSQLSKTQLIL